MILRARKKSTLTCVYNNIDEIHALCESVPQVDVVEGHDAALPLGAFEGFAPFQRFLSPHLVLVELGKVIDNDRNGQRDYQDTAYTTYTSYNFP